MVTDAVKSRASLFAHRYFVNIPNAGESIDLQLLQDPSTRDIVYGTVRAIGVHPIGLFLRRTLGSW